MKRSWSPIDVTAAGQGEGITSNAAAQAESGVDGEWLHLETSPEALGRNMQKAVIFRPPIYCHVAHRCVNFNALREQVVDRAFDRNHPSVRVSKSNIGGHGLFAANQFKRGDVVLEFFGVTFARGHAPAASTDYLLGLNASFQVDPLHDSIPAAWRLAWAANHSCDPNLIALKTSFRRLGFSAREALYLRLSPSGVVAHDNTGREATRTALTTDRDNLLCAELRSGGEEAAQLEERRRDGVMEGEGRGGASAAQAPRTSTGRRSTEVRQSIEEGTQCKRDGKDSPTGEDRHDGTPEEAGWDDVIFLVAWRDIAEGEELCFDYRRGASAEGRGRSCQCGSSFCRGTY